VTGVSGVVAASPTAGVLCALGTSRSIAADCYANIANPKIDASLGYQPYKGIYGLYASSIIHQQGFNFGDTITVTPKWLLRVAASQDWTWTTSYSASGNASSNVPHNTITEKTGYMTQAASPTASVMYKPRPNQTAYVTWADSIQAPDTAPAKSTGILVSNDSEALPPYRSTELEMGYKVESQRMNFAADIFRIRRPFADVVVDPSVAVGGTCGVDGTLPSGSICETDQIVGQQINAGAEAMLSGNITKSLRIIGGITALTPRLTHTFVMLKQGDFSSTASGIVLPLPGPPGTPQTITTTSSTTPPSGTTVLNPYLSASCAVGSICPTFVTNNKNLVGIPDYKSNILAEYQLPVLSTAYFTFDWQHVGRRAADDMNSYWVPQYNDFDLGGRYSARVFGNLATWIVTFNNISNVHYWSTLGPGSITGQSSADLAHMGEPRLITATMRYDF
jgi:outer membrane receptor protein involved in Fe transport